MSWIPRSIRNLYSRIANPDAYVFRNYNEIMATLARLKDGWFINGFSYSYADGKVIISARGESHALVLRESFRQSGWNLPISVNGDKVIIETYDDKTLKAINIRPAIQTIEHKDAPPETHQYTAFNQNAAIAALNGPQLNRFTHNLKKTILHAEKLLPHIKLTPADNAAKVTEAPSEQAAALPDNKPENTPIGENPSRAVSPDKSEPLTGLVVAR